MNSRSSETFSTDGFLKSLYFNIRSAGNLTKEYRHLNIYSIPFHFLSRICFYWLRWCSRVVFPPISLQCCESAGASILACASAAPCRKPCVRARKATPRCCLLKACCSSVLRSPCWRFQQRGAKTKTWRRAEPSTPPPPPRTSRAPRAARGTSNPSDPVKETFKMDVSTCLHMVP